MMNKRVYGVLGIKAVMSNWNADFTGYPKSISTGEIFGSDKALKYPMKKMWESQGKKVLYIKSYITKVEKDKDKDKNKDKEKNTEKVKSVKLVPRSLKERYEQIFEIPNLGEEKDTTHVITNLFKAVDVKNFGATFAEEGKNISITGAVQIGQGFNKYEGTTIEEQSILSPFRDATKEDADASTIGTKIVCNEAHYFYPFVINPKAYDEYVKLGFTEGYTEDDYNSFKEAALMGATAFNSNSKVGCENEFGLFIETSEELYLPDLAQYIYFKKGNGKDIIGFEFNSLLDKVKKDILKIEVYYNSLKVDIENKLDSAVYYNIFTKEEIGL